MVGTNNAEGAVVNGVPAVRLLTHNADQKGGAPFPNSPDRATTRSVPIELELEHRRASVTGEQQFAGAIWAI